MIGKAHQVRQRGQHGCPISRRERGRDADSRRWKIEHGGTIRKEGYEVNERKASQSSLPSRQILRYTCSVRDCVLPRLHPASFACLSRLVLWLILLTLSACGGPSKLFNRSSEPDGYWLPLTVDLRLDSSVPDAALTYVDACGQRQNRRSFTSALAGSGRA